MTGSTPDGDAHPGHGDVDRETEQADTHDELVTEGSAGPIDEEDMAAAEGLAVTDDEAAAYQDSGRKGAALEGEGRFT